MTEIFAVYENGFRDGVAEDRVVPTVGAGDDSEFANNAACVGIALEIRKDHGSDPPQVETK